MKINYPIKFEPILKDFKISFLEQKIRFVKVVANSLKETTSSGGVWLFIDEILID